MGTAPGYDVIHVGFLLGHGGDALQMLTLAQGTQQAGLRTKVVVPRTAESVKFEERCRAAGVECERTSLISADMTGPTQSIRSLSRLLGEAEARVFHFHSGNSCLPRALMVTLELRRPRHAVATLQSPIETIVPGSLRARTWSFFANRRLDAVISPSAHGSSFQRRCGVSTSRVQTIRNAVEVARFASGDPTGPRVLLGAREDEPIVLFASRLDRQKGPVQAVEIFARAARRFPAARLVFVGTGSEDSAIRAAAARLGVADRTQLMGYQTNIPDWLAAATVWLLPTERENFSVAVLEALAAGLPIVSTSCPGNDEVLVGEQNAITFPVGDIATAAAGLARVLGDPDLRRRLRAEARLTAAENSAEAMVERVRALYPEPGSSLSAQQHLQRGER
jgi:glycosyltransferase involved in cell wall biosynthesis